MSGVLPDWVTVDILALNASFSIGTFLIVTFGCAAWYSFTFCAKKDFIGSAVEMFHHSTVTFPAEALPLAVLPVLAWPPHPLRTSPAAASITTLRRLNDISVVPSSSADPPRGQRDSRREF